MSLSGKSFAVARGLLKVDTLPHSPISQKDETETVDIMFSAKPENSLPLYFLFWAPQKLNGIRERSVSQKIRGFDTTARRF